MFAEELSGNASKKRQEEARARRKQLKQQQQKQKQKPTSTAPKPTASFLSNTASLPSVAPPAPPIDIPEPGPPTTTKNTAVQNALQQRQLRQRTQLELKSAVRIQSFYRAHRSNCNLLKNQAKILSARLQDLITLTGLLKQRTNADYIPPPATASVLVLQLLFLNKTLPCKRSQSVLIRSHDDVVRLQQVIQYVVLPGIRGTEENLDPILPWPPSRLLELLRLALVVAVLPGVQDATLAIINTFLRTLIGTATEKARPSIVEEARHYLFPVTPLSFAVEEKTESGNNKKGKKKPYPHETIGSTLDLLLILRHHLLFSQGYPIPENASRLREGCFTNGEQSQTDVLFLLAVDGIMSAPFEQWRHHSRFLTEIMTVPLVTWKTSVKSTAKLLSGSPTPIFLTLLASVTEKHAATLSAGKIGTLLPSVDVPLTACPATNSQCLLANLIQVGRACPVVNGSAKTNYREAALFFNFVATLLDVVPLATLSAARESAVEWISDGKSHLTAVVLSPVVLEQCKYILHDSFVRDLFAFAIDDEAMGTDKTLREKTDKDMKQEKDLSGTATAAGLAAKEARIDRSKGFWNSSKWAKNVKKGVSKMLAGEDNKKELKSTSKKGLGLLVNTSSLSRKLADGSSNKRILTSQESTSSSSSLKRAPFDSVMYFALCRAYGIVLSRWGGGGRDDIVGRKTSEEALRYKESQDKRSFATMTADPCTLSLLNVLSFSTPIVRTTWAQTQSNADVVKALYEVIDESRGPTPVRLLAASVKWGPGSRNNDGAMQLLIFLYTLAHTLIITDDVEIHDMDKPIPLHQLRRCIQVLKKLLYRACCTDVGKPIHVASNYFGLSLIAASAKTMRDLYDRSSRRPLCLLKLWIVEDLMEQEIRRCKSYDEYVKLLSAPVLRICPFLVSFKRRLKLFERIVTTNRIEIQGQHNSNPFAMDSGFKPGIPVRIMRGRVLEDGLSTMNKLGRDMRKRIVVHYMNDAGAQEAGVDVGGLFKEFWTDLSAIAFDPNYALFRVTEDAGNCMYPSPASGAAHGSDHIVLFEFLGRILGKALYEGITIQPQFAHFFLSFLRGDYNFLHMLPDLSTMDPQLHSNLMFLKNYDGDAEDLCLTFTVANDDFGGNNEIPLIPNGANIVVTNTNKQHYVGLVAKYRLYDRLKEQSQAFTRGLWDVIERPWLQLFNEPELQILISGPSDGGIDVEDMRANTRYAGGFTGIDRTVNRFWSVMASFNSEQQALLLRFVTSCERPPPLGFASMNPPFTIQRVGILRDGDKLPMASTCFNTLKLPTYSSEKVLKQRLLYSIESGAGFELS